MDNKNRVPFSNSEEQLFLRDFDINKAEFAQPTGEMTGNERHIGNRALFLEGDNESQGIKEESIPEPQAPLDNDSSRGHHNPNIKTTDRLTHEALSATNITIDKFKKTGDAAGFYEEARGLMEENLVNSFQRDLSYKAESKK